MLKSFPIAVLFVLAWIQPGLSDDATAPPGLTSDEVDGQESGFPPNTDRVPAAGLNLGDFRVNFEGTGLFKIALAIPSGPLSESGQEHYNRHWLCYTIDQGERQRLWITSDYEFGGPELAALGVTATVLQEGEGATDDCPLLPPKYNPVLLDSGVWLGLSRWDLATKFPSVRIAGTTRPYFSSVRPAGGDFEVGNFLVVEFRHDRIFRLWASQTTTN